MPGALRQVTPENLVQDEVYSGYLKIGSATEKFKLTAVWLQIESFFIDLDQVALTQSRLKLSSCRRRYECPVILDCSKVDRKTRSLRRRLARQAKGARERGQKSSARRSGSSSRSRSRQRSGAENRRRSERRGNRSAQPEGTSSSGQAGFRSAAGINHHPVDRSGILPELLREDLGRRIGGVAASRAKATFHRRRWSREPETRKRDGGCLGCRHEGLAFLGLQGDGIDDHRIPCGERRCEGRFARPAETADRNETARSRAQQSSCEV